MLVRISLFHYFISSTFCLVEVWCNQTYKNTQKNRAMNGTSEKTAAIEVNGMDTKPSSMKGKVAIAAATASNVTIRSTNRDWTNAPWPRGRNPTKNATHTRTTIKRSIGMKHCQYVQSTSPSIRAALKPSVVSSGTQMLATTAHSQMLAAFRMHQIAPQQNKTQGENTTYQLTKSSDIFRHRKAANNAGATLATVPKNTTSVIAPLNTGLF